jgi:hypothetical protein
MVENVLTPRCYATKNGFYSVDNLPIYCGGDYPLKSAAYVSNARVGIQPNWISDCIWQCAPSQPRMLPRTLTGCLKICFSMEIGVPHSNLLKNFLFIIDPPF